ncbi:MAG: S-layer homology domain-containing protein, partial [Lawsonibacter sp.]|nr:S-layer homology domain-containing protein [Lawsonibacter sp.]
MKSKSLSLALALVLALSLAVPALAVYETPTFSDVPKSFWGYASIEQAAEHKWISGNPDGTFAPNANVTYAQFCVMLVSAFFPEQLASYTGPTSPWYVPACMVAAQNDLLLGTAVEQTPTQGEAVGQPMSRYEMALVVSNTLYKINAKLPTPKERADQM